LAHFALYAAHQGVASQGTALQSVCVVRSQVAYGGLQAVVGVDEIVDGSACSGLIVGYCECDWFGAGFLERKFDSFDNILELIALAGDGDASVLRRAIDINLGIDGGLLCYGMHIVAAESDESLQVAVSGHSDLCDCSIGAGGACCEHQTVGSS